MKEENISKITFYQLFEFDIQNLFFICDLSYLLAWILKKELTKQTNIFRKDLIKTDYVLNPYSLNNALF
jgi:hypothetical protein